MQQDLEAARNIQRSLLAGWLHPDGGGFGTPLGLLPSMGYKTVTVTFPTGARLLLYTDGLTEIFCGEDEFGCDRLTEHFRSLPADDSGAMLDTLWRKSQEFASGGPQTDDMIALAICHKLVSAQGSVSE